MNDLPPPMRTVWHSLLWKEWHEHKWKLAALLSISVPLLCLFGFDGPSNLRLGMVIIPTCYCLLVGTFLGMSTAGGESGRRTLRFLQSLPVPMWQPGGAKLAVALFTAALPLLVLVGMFCVWWSFFWFDGVELSLGNTRGMGIADRSWGNSNWLVGTTVCSILGVSSLLLWMAAMGLNRADEIRAGAIGFLTICLVWFLLALGLELAERQDLPTLRYWVEVLYAAAPGGVAFVWAGFGGGGNLNWWYNYGPFLVSAIIGHGCVLAWYLRRFGKAKPGVSQTDGKTLALDTDNYQFLAPPMRSQLTAIAWKQFRETGPLALIAMGAVFLITVIVYFSNERRIVRQDLGETMAGTTMMVGFFVTLVTGIGVFLEDLKPRVDDFWRSRPVNYQLWFGVKFVVGAALLIVSFGILMLLALWINGGSLLRGEPHPVLMLVFVCASFLIIYTLSMATYCALRQPLYAAVLTLGIFFGGLYAYRFMIFIVFNQHSWPWTADLSLLLLSQVAATAFAWQAVKRNWHWGSR